MVQPHLIVVDLDGTLLTSEQQIGKLTKQTLLRAKDAGHHVMIATGRPFRASKTYYDELQLKTPIVNFNGALTHHPLMKHWQHEHHPLDLHTVHEILEELNNFQWQNIIAEVRDDVYFHYEDSSLRDSFKMGNPIVKTGLFTDTLKDAPTSLLVQTSKAEMGAIQNHLQLTHANIVHHRPWSYPWQAIEIVRHGVNKAIGVNKVAMDLDVPRERIIAFGDEHNDLEMIDYAGIGVAMENGIDELKNIANVVTNSNNKEGIANFLMDRLHLQ